MKKSVQIVLKKSYQPLGEINTIQNVALGYASNYLIPKGIAEIATEKIIKHINYLNRIKEKESAAAKLNYEIKKTIINDIYKICIRKNKVKERKFFNRINENEIMQIIFDKTGEIIKKKEVKINEINTYGIHKVILKLTSGTPIVLKLQIIPRTI